MGPISIQEYIERNGYLKTLEWIDNHRGEIGKNFKSRIQLADACTQVLKPQHAIEHLQILIEDFVNSPLPYIKMVKFLLSQNKFGLLFKYLSIGLKKHPTNENLLHQSVSLSIRFQQWEDAKRQLESLKIEYPDFSEIPLLSLVLQIKSQKKQSRELYAKLSLKQQFRIEFMLQHYDSLIELCNKGIQANTNKKFWLIKALQVAILNKEDKSTILNYIEDLKLLVEEFTQSDVSLINEISTYSHKYESKIIAVIPNKEKTVISTVALQNSKPYISAKSKKIDVVYTWANMGQSDFYKKFKDTTGIDPALSKDNQQNLNRYLSHGEILLSLLSIQKYFPSVNNIYIVTPGQSFSVHDLAPWMQSKISFIDQDTILPSFLIGKVFNSTIFETFLFKIPKLSENFLYFCDDYFLGNHIKEDDFFYSDGVPKVNLIHQDLLKFQNVKSIPKTFGAIPKMYVENCRKLFVETFKTEPQLTFAHQAMLMNKEACQKTVELFHEQWKDSFYKDSTRGRNTVFSIVLMNWIGIYFGYQRLNEDYEHRINTIAFHNGFSAENLHYVKSKKPKYFCINNIPDQNSKENLNKLFEYFNSEH